VKINAAEASPQVLRQYSGVYHSEELNADLRLDVLGDRLIATVGSNAKTPLVPLSANKFLSLGGATFNFERGADQQIGRFDYSSSRVRDLLFERKPALAAP
jgi:hypothetical protein